MAKKFSYNPGEGVIIDEVDENSNTLDRYFFAVSAPGFKIHLDPHASESYDQITSVEDEALEAASNAVELMGHLSPEALQFFAGVLDAELSSRSGCPQ